MDEIEAVSEKLSSYAFVKKVELSQKPFIKTEFESKKHEKEKEEYRIGI